MPEGFVVWQSIKWVPPLPYFERGHYYCSKLCNLLARGHLTCDRTKRKPASHILRLSRSKCWATANKTWGISTRKIWGYCCVICRAVAGIISLLRFRLPLVAAGDAGPFSALLCGHFTAFSDSSNWLELPGAISDRARVGFSSPL